MNRCTECHYGKRLRYKSNPVEDDVFCDYFCMTGYRRSYTDDVCDVFKPKGERKNNFNNGDIAK